MEHWPVLLTCENVTCSGTLDLDLCVYNSFNSALTFFYSIFRFGNFYNINTSFYETSGLKTIQYYYIIYFKNYLQFKWRLLETFWRSAEVWNPSSGIEKYFRMLAVISKKRLKGVSTQEKKFWIPKQPCNVLY